MRNIKLIIIFLFLFCNYKNLQAEPIESHFPWTKFLRAITNCDSFPFPNCRKRINCESSRNYWYNGKCNTNSHYDYELLKNLNGWWHIYLSRNTKCGYKYSLLSSNGYFQFMDEAIGDDNILVQQYDPNKLTYIDSRYKNYKSYPHPWNINYAYYNRISNQYVVKFMANNWGGNYPCTLPNGQSIDDFDILLGDQVIHTFTILPNGEISGQAQFVNSDVILEMTGEKVIYGFNN